MFSMTVTSVSVRLVAIVVLILCQRLQAALVVSAPKGVGPPPPMHRKCPVWKNSITSVALTDRQTDIQIRGGLTRGHLSVHAVVLSHF